MIGAFHGWGLAIATHCVFLAALPFSIRLFGGERRHVETVIGTALAVLASTLALFSHGLDNITFWSFVTLYGFLFIVFLQAFAILYKSISLRVLVEIARLPTQSLPIDEVYTALVADGAFARRLSGLEKGGHLYREGNDILLTEKGRVVADRISAAQRLFGIDASG